MERSRSLVKQRMGIFIIIKIHYELHKPEPHILLFRRPLGTDPNTGL